MKVRITATVTYETNTDAELYEHLETPPLNDEEVFDWEREHLGTGDTPLIESLRDWGAFSEVKIEKVEPVA